MSRGEDSTIRAEQLANEMIEKVISNVKVEDREYTAQELAQGVAENSAIIKGLTVDMNISFQSLSNFNDLLVNLIGRVVAAESCITKMMAEQSRTSEFVANTHEIVNRIEGLSSEMAEKTKRMAEIVLPEDEGEEGGRDEEKIKDS